jgi:hypothetical protein
VCSYILCLRQCARNIHLKIASPWAGNSSILSKGSLLRELFNRPLTVQSTPSLWKNNERATRYLNDIAS